MSDERWNHNVHLHPVVLDAVPTGAQRGLDVGCGEGMLARPRLPRDIPWELAGGVTTRRLKLSRPYWEHSAPIVWPPPETYGTMRAIAEQVLPGARYRRHVLWRYSLIWERSR